MNAPNLLSILRIALTPVAAALVAQSSPFALPILGLGLLTDFLDGWIARRRGTTPLGRILDPLADKIFAGGVLVALAVSGRVAWEIASLVLVRDVVLLAVGWIKLRSGDPIPSANLSGKIAFAALGGYLGALVLGWAIPPWVGGFIAILYVLTGLTYAIHAPAVLPERAAKGGR
jgi:phosphatidylglycerophosphate synthase